MTASNSPARRSDPESDPSRGDELWDSFDPMLDPACILIALAIFAALAKLILSFESGP